MKKPTTTKTAAPTAAARKLGGGIAAFTPPPAAAAPVAAPPRLAGDKNHVQIPMSRASWRRLKELAIEQNVPVTVLGLRAFSLLFKSYGLPQLDETNVD